MGSISKKKQVRVKKDALPGRYVLGSRLTPVMYGKIIFLY